MFLRLRTLQGISQMQDGWVDARAFYRAPEGFKWDKLSTAYVKEKKRKDGSIERVESRSARRMAMDLLAKEASADGA